MAPQISDILEIHNLAEPSVPRVRLPDRGTVFARRALRLRQLSVGASIGDYLRFLAMLVDAQHVAIARLSVSIPPPAHINAAIERRIPPIEPATWPRTDAWFETLETLCAALAVHAESPAGVNQMISRIRRAPRAWLESQADALLQSASEAIDAPVAPLVMASLQVHWTALAASFSADTVDPPDAPGLCPLCGSQPVASVVHAQAPFQGNRYLHCALCATEWHLVRAQCTRCAATGSSVAYHAATMDSDASNGSGAESPVRAETCDQCHGYRKIVYQDIEPTADPVADDLATLKLDLLVGEKGYHRASGNPLLWQPHDA